MRQSSLYSGKRRSALLGWSTDRACIQIHQLRDRFTPGIELDVAQHRVHQRAKPPTARARGWFGRELGGDWDRVTRRGLQCLTREKYQELRLCSLMDRLCTGLLPFAVRGEAYSTVCGEDLFLAK